MNVLRRTAEVLIVIATGIIVVLVVAIVQVIASARR